MSEKLIKILSQLIVNILHVHIYNAVRIGLEYMILSLCAMLSTICQEGKPCRRLLCHILHYKRCLDEDGP